MSSNKYCVLERDSYNNMGKYMQMRCAGEMWGVSIVGDLWVAHIEDGLYWLVFVS